MQHVHAVRSVLWRGNSEAPLAIRFCSYISSKMNSLTHCGLAPSEQCSRPSRSRASWPSQPSALLRRQAACRCRCQHSDDAQSSALAPPSRRQVLAAPLAAAVLAATLQRGLPALAFTPPVQGQRRHEDKLDGYTFDFPEVWIPVTTSGNDVFYRNPYNVEENLFVNLSSPSSSQFADVSVLGSPEDAAKRLLSQTLEEFMSTRIGSRKEAEIVGFSQREAGGRLYYDVELVARSFASRNQLAVSLSEVDTGSQLEWERHYLTTLGVANKRLYEFRIQTSEAAYKSAEPTLRAIANSFRVKEVEV